MTLREYVEALERHLGRLSGRDHVLSPEDFALARSWHAAGIPLAEVLAALDAARPDAGPPRSLRYVRRAVEARPRG